MKTREDKCSIEKESGQEISGERFAELGASGKKREVGALITLEYPEGVSIFSYTQTPFSAVAIRAISVIESLAKEIAVSVLLNSIISFHRKLHILPISGVIYT